MSTTTHGLFARTQSLPWLAPARSPGDPRALSHPKLSQQPFSFILARPSREIFRASLGSHATYTMEPVKHFIGKAEELLAPTGALSRTDGHRCVSFFAQPLEGFHPEPQRYDVIWIQWCVGHLTDEDFVSFFQRCATGLRPGGIIVVKENNTKVRTSHKPYALNPKP